MSIFTTETVSREWAVNRITTVLSLVEQRNFYELAKITFEPNYTTKDLFLAFTQWVRDYPLNLKELNLLTNFMLAEIIDWPWFRETYTTNYFVKDSYD